MTDFSNLKALNPHTARNEYFAYIHATMIQFKISIFKHCSGKEKKNPSHSCQGKIAKMHNKIYYR